jgi:hypothetical protein
MIDASPGTGPNDIHDYVPEDDVSIITNTEELFEEQDEIMDMAVLCIKQRRKKRVIDVLKKL